MSKGVTDRKHYQAIADTVRKYIPLEEKYSPSELSGMVDAVYDEGKIMGEIKGYDNGLTVGREECAAKHFVQVVTGDGSGALTADIPFEPDCVTVFGYDPLSVATNNAVLLFTADLRAFSYFVGIASASKGGTTAPYSAGLRRSAALQRFAWNDGNATFKDMPASGGATSGVFASGAQYVVSAQKYTDKTDKERITAFVQALADSGGSVTLTTSIINNAFTDEEWSALISAKPTWTFTLAE